MPCGWKFDHTLPAPLLVELRHNLRLENSDIYQLERPFMLGALTPLLDVPLEQHRYQPFNPRLPRPSGQQSQYLCLDC